MLATIVGFLFLAAGGLLGSSGYEFWFFHRTPPASLHWEPFLGMVYDREVRRQPRPLVVHLVRTDLQAPGIECLVTPGDAVKDGEIRARTTSEFLEEFGLQVAINAGFFSPFYSNGPLDYYPHIGDPVDVEGLAMANGRE